MVEGNYNCFLSENIIDNTGITAIQAFSPYPSPVQNNIDIQDNQIQHAVMGIQLNNFPTSIVRIQRNELTHIDHTAIFHSSAVNGIPIFRSELDLITDENNISEVHIGINIANQDNVYVNNNEVFAEHSNGTSNPSAIRLGNIGILHAHQNEVTNQSTQNGFSGIYTSISRDIFMSCNEAIETGQAFTFEGNNSFNFSGQASNALFVGNTILNAYDGVALRNEGEIGDQGTPGVGGNVHDNEWQGTMGNFGIFCYSTFGFITIGGDSPFWVRPIGSFFPSSDKDGLSFNIVPANPITSPTQVSCAPQTPTFFPESVEEGQMPLTSTEIEEKDWSYLEDIANDSTSTSGDYLNQRYLFQALIAEPLLDSILFYSPPLDTFLDSCTNAPIGILNKVDILIAEGKYKEAWIWNNSIITSQFYELNDILVNDIWLSQKLSQGLPYTQHQLDLLMTVAEQCPAQGGPAVFRARSILLQDQIENYSPGMQLYTFMDSCDTTGTNDRIGKIITNPTTPGYLLEVYPNPAWDQITLNYQTEGASFIRFELYDAFGKKILKQELLPEIGTQSLNISQIASGMYFYRWIVDGRQIKSERLLIIR